jgi:hypothetical protein
MSTAGSTSAPPMPGSLQRRSCVSSAMAYLGYTGVDGTSYQPGAADLPAQHPESLLDQPRAGPH